MKGVCKGDSLLLVSKVKVSRSKVNHLVTGSVDTQPATEIDIRVHLDHTNSFLLIKPDKAQH